MADCAIARKRDIYYNKIKVDSTYIKLKEGEKE